MGLQAQYENIEIWPLLPTEFEWPDFICNRDGLAYPKPSCVVNVGDTVPLFWSQRGHEPASEVYFDSHHPGPCLVYVAEKSEPSKWFKLWEEGWDGYSWCTEKIHLNGLRFFRIPESLPSGEYVFRVEIINLWQSWDFVNDVGDDVKAQFWMSCVDVNVQNPDASVRLPDNSKAVYFGASNSEFKKGSPSFMWDVRTPGKNHQDYPIPGGPVLFAGSSVTTNYLAQTS